MPEGNFAAPRSLVALPFVPVDIDGLARKWKLRDQGEADGRLDLPAPDATALSAAEQKIQVRMTAERDRLAGELIVHLNAQNEALARLDTPMDIAGLRKDCAHAVSQLEQTHVAWKAEIPRLLRRAREAQAEYCSFRSRHRLDRPAREPGHRGLALALLVLCVVLESALNGFFFAQGSDTGLIGGVAVALSISVVNVLLLGMVLGFGPARWVHRRNWLLRGAGILILLAGGVLLIVLNAFVGHYRDAFERLGDSVQLDAVWAHLGGHPFDLARLESWLLFLLGLGFAGIGFVKGYHLDDPYPGYGAVARRWQAAEHEYLVNRNLRLEEATAVRDHAIRDIATAIESLRGAAMQREQALGQRARWLADFAAHEEHLAGAANQLLSIWREANRRHRTQPSPKYFTTGFAFPDHVLERPDIRARSGVPPPKHDAETLIGELDRLRGDVLAAYRAVYDDAPPEI